MTITASDCSGECRTGLSKIACQKLAAVSEELGIVKDIGGAFLCAKID